MKAIYSCEEEFSDFKNICRLSTRYKVHHLEKQIDYNKDQIIAFLNKRQTQHKVYSQICLWLRWNLHRQI